MTELNENLMGIQFTDLKKEREKNTKMTDYAENLPDEEETKKKKKKKRNKKKKKSAEKVTVQDDTEQLQNTINKISKKEKDSDESDEEDVE